MQTHEKNISVDGAVRAFYKFIDQRVVPILEFCPKAGYCAYDCHFYITHPRNDLVPGKKGYKLRAFYKKEFSLAGKLLGSLIGARDISPEDLEEWVELAYKFCSYCDRCSISCPYSLLNPPLTFFMRAMIHGAGLTPPSLLEMLKNEIDVGHPLGITKEEWINFVKEYEKESGTKVPIDVKGAEILYLPGYRSLKDNPESIKAAFKIFNALDVNWTVSSELYTASLFPFEIAAFDELTELLKKRTSFIENMGIKKVVIGSDGEGYYAWRWESGRYLGRRPNFEIYHITEFLAEQVRAGKLKLKKVNDTTIYTYQDPCNLARKGGVVDEPRILIDSLGLKFKEMPQHGVYSYCCSAGCFEPKEYWDTRMEAFKVKMEQIEATSAKKIITACDMCLKTIKDGLQKYGYEAEVIDLTQLIAENME